MIFEYANLTKNRWPGAEKFIIKSPKNAYHYAKYIIKELKKSLE